MTVGTAGAGERVINVTQGEYRVSDDPETVLTTLLGSCVAVCMTDPVRGIGGINHFLLPEDRNGRGTDERYGVNAMELLINGLMKGGASRDRLQAKVFGGARMNDHFRDIGSANIAFARNFLAGERITFGGESVGGVQARRIQFWPTTFRARQRLVPRDVVQEKPARAAPADVTLF